MWGCLLTRLLFAFTSQWKMSESWVPCQGSVRLTGFIPRPPAIWELALRRGTQTPATAQTGDTQAKLTPRHKLSVSEKQSTMEITELHREIDKDFCWPTAMLLGPGHKNPPVPTTHMAQRLQSPRFPAHLLSAAFANPLRRSQEQGPRKHYTIHSPTTSWMRRSHGLIC